MSVIITNPSDDLDGYIARKYKLERKWGEKADGVADVGGWIITWVAMLYAFGIWRVLVPGTLWILGVVIMLCLDRPMLGLDYATTLPLLVAVFHAAYPPR